MKAYSIINVIITIIFLIQMVAQFIEWVAFLYAIWALAFAVVNLVIAFKEK